MKFTQLLFLFFSGFLLSISALGQQSFLHAEGTEIVDGTGQPVLLRGMGLGGWMLQEGYMMESSGFGNTQHELKALIREVAGNEGHDLFYEAWLANYCTRQDVDSMAAWGFNSLRLPMHYNLFTLPIEDEPIAGQDSWLTKGFEMIDSLLDWCEANEMYLILDLHAAPGGQGEDQAISDYDPNKPSLWESAENRRKTVALWKKLAERYANEPWIGGYDLINETNWNMSGNLLLKNLYLDITKAIREVDTNHLLFIEGNWFANDFAGLTPPWDDNMAYSFHKYWSYNDQGSIQWVLDMRNRYNVPLWMGEAGENSNTWFTNAIELFEQNNIGWAWWPYKKIGSVTGTVTIPKTAGYQKLLNYWGGNGAKPSAGEATQYLLEQAEKLKLNNCIIRYEVIDAMFRQAQGDRSAQAFKNHRIPGTVFATDYDFGGNRFAYFDSDTANYQVSTGVFTAWNSGYAYRNDGVDIEACNDALSNGFSLGWTNTREWLNYTVEVDSTAAYDLKLRYAASGSGGKFHFELNGVHITPVKTLSATGGWSSWADFTVEDVVLEKGTHQLKLFIDNAGFNINYFQLENPKNISGISPQFVHLKTDVQGEYVLLMTNLGVLENELPSRNDFELKINNQTSRIEDVTVDPLNPKVVRLKLEEDIIQRDRLILSYTANTLKSPDEQIYNSFASRLVENVSPQYVVLPAKIEAEDFKVNNGFQTEDCTDNGGGFNLAFANPGDYVDYPVFLYESGEFSFNYRVASDNSGKFKTMLVTKDETIDLHTITASTSGWQSWKTVTASASLPKGKFTLRIHAISGEFNLNWFQVDVATGTGITDPEKGEINFSWSGNRKSISLHNGSQFSGMGKLQIFDLTGRQWINRELLLTADASQMIENINLKPGGYIVKFQHSKVQSIQKLWVE